MNQYKIFKIGGQEFDLMVLCLTDESLFNYLQGLEKQISNLGSNGKIIIDQLFLTGENYNRFMSLDFRDGRLDLKSARNVNPGSQIRLNSVDWLSNNTSYLNGSILSDDQKKRITQHMPF